MLRYEIILYWSEEDQVFIAEVPELYQFSVNLHLIIGNKRLYSARVPADMFAKY